MSDDLDKLKAAMRVATPAPDTARKAADLALAQKNFADLQGSRDEPRPMSDRPVGGLWTGVRKMFATMTTRGGLVATTAIVAVGFVLLTPLGRDVMAPQDLVPAVLEEEAPVVERADLRAEAPPAPEVRKRAAEAPDRSRM